MPPAEKLTTGRRPFCPTHSMSSSGAAISFAMAKRSSAVAVTTRRMSCVMVFMWRTASTTLPVPASPLVRIIAAPSATRRRASPRLVAPHTNGTVNARLSTWLASSAGVSTSDSSM